MQYSLAPAVQDQHYYFRQNDAAVAAGVAPELRAQSYTASSLPRVSGNSDTATITTT